METVNNLTLAASRVIWGDPNKDTDTTATNEEPVSGETGDVSAGEPYDKGNAEPTSTPSNDESTNPTSTSNTTASDTPSTSTTSTKTDLPGSTPAAIPIRSGHETSNTGVTAAHNPTSSNDNSAPDAPPSVGADPSSAPQQTQKQQGADRPTDAPTEGSDEHDRIAATKKEAEDAAKVDMSGPGPKALTEVKHDGASASAAEGEDGPQKESHGEGTGKKYFKSSGMKVDGGDFDAANPGAGREADRLLDAKGVHREVPGKTAPADTSSKTDSKDTSESDGKLSLKDKIKAKLHRN